MMIKKRLIILLVSLLLFFSLFSIVSSVNAAYDEAWDEGYYYESHKSWFTYHPFNCTVIDKYYLHFSFQPSRDYAYYLVDANGKIGFFELKGGPDANRFQIGDKLTLNGSMVDEPRNNHHLDSRIFGEKISEQSIPKIRFNQIKLADGFVRGGSTYSTSPSSSSSNKGISFSESKKYFKNASNIVRKHVFDESDSNGDGYLSKSELNTFKDVKRFTCKYANIKNEEYVETPNLWTGDGTTRTRYCADHGRVAVGKDNKCPWCKKYRRDPRTRVDSTRYV